MSEPVVLPAADSAGLELPPPIAATSVLPFAEEARAYQYSLEAVVCDQVWAEAG